MKEKEAVLPIVSIHIPTFNREKFIGDCINSALNQTIKDIEIIVVDNASTDGTWEICQAYAARDPRIRVFRNETNIGPVRNWLRCIKEARGEYSKILFSDDLMAPDFLASTLPFLEDPSVAFVYTSVYIGGTIETGFVCFSNGPKTLYSIEEYFALLIRRKVPYSPGAAIFRTTDIRKNLHDTLPTCRPHEFSRHGAGPDVMIYALTALEYKTVAAIDKPLVFFRAHDDSITIANANSDVSEGYLLALSWFFMKRVSRALWWDYLVWQWTDNLITTRSWLSVEEFIKKYEGTGTLKEQIQFVVKVPILIFSRIWHNLIKYGMNKASLFLAE